MRTQNNIRKCFLVSFFFIAFTFSKAQTNAIEVPQKVRLGMKFSPTFGWAKVLEGSLSSNGLGLNIGYGVMADFNISKNPNYWLSTEFNITTIQTQLESPDPLYITDGTGLERQFTNATL